MSDWLSRNVLAIVSAVAGAALLVAPVLFGSGYDAGARLSSGLIGVVTLLSAVGLGYGSLEFWSRFALGLGTWTLVAPILFGFYQVGAGFWTHLVVGFASLLVGVAGHELMIRKIATRNRDRRGEAVERVKGIEPSS